MTTHEYLQALGIKPDSCIDLAFMLGEFVGKSRQTGHIAYHSTPCRTIADWYNVYRTDERRGVRADILDYIVLNNEVYDLPWLSGVSWANAIKNHNQMMILVAPREELLKYYSERHVDCFTAYIEGKIRQEIIEGTNPWLNNK